LEIKQSNFQNCVSVFAVAARAAATAAFVETLLTVFRDVDADFALQVDLPLLPFRRTRSFRFSAVSKQSLIRMAKH